MKRTVYIFVFLFALILTPLFFSHTVCAVTEQEGFKGEIEDAFFGSIDDEIYEILEEFGLDSFDAENIFSNGGENIRKYFVETLGEKLKGAIGWFFMGICIIMLMSIISGAFDFSLSNDAFSVFTAAIICVVTVGKISTFINCVLSSMALIGKLMLSFIFLI